MVQRVIVIVEAEQERADHRAGALLVPAEAGDHAISRALVLHLDHRAFPGAIGRVETLCHDTIEPGALEAAGTRPPHPPDPPQPGKGVPPRPRPPPPPPPLPAPPATPPS